MFDPPHGYFISKSEIFCLKGFLPGRRRYEDEWRTVYVLNKYPSDDPDVEVKQKRYANNVIVTSKVSLTISNLHFRLNYGRFLLDIFGSGSMIEDCSDHGKLKQPINP